MENQSENPSTQGITDFIERLLPLRSKEFTLVLKDKKPEEKEFFELRQDPKTINNIMIIGNSLSSLSCGFHNYLKKICKIHYGEVGGSINPKLIPSPLPKVPQPITQTTWC